MRHKAMVHGCLALYQHRRCEREGCARVCYRMPVNLRLATGDRVGLGKIQWR